MLGLGEVCRQFIFDGVKPEHVVGISFKVRNMPVVDIGPSFDVEEGRWVQAGERLKVINGLYGLHLSGGAFSVVLEDLPGRGMAWDYADGAQVQISLHKDMPVGQQFSMVMVCTIY